MRFWYHENLSIGTQDNFSLNDFMYFIDNYGKARTDCVFEMTVKNLKSYLENYTHVVLATLDDCDLLEKFGFTEFDDDHIVAQSAVNELVNHFLNENKTVNYDLFNKVFTPSNSEEYSLYEAILFAVENNKPDAIRLLDLVIAENYFLGKHRMTAFAALERMAIHTAMTKINDYVNSYKPFENSLMLPDAISQFYDNSIKTVDYVTWDSFGHSGSRIGIVKP